MDDVSRLLELNDRFVDAFRRGSWKQLRPILAPDFSYLDGASGEVWSLDRYVADVDGHPLGTIASDQVQVHVAGDVGVVSARTTVRSGAHNRYVDTYARSDGRWLCVHACVWPVDQGGSG